MLEANASVVLWLQWLIVQVLAATRLATSVGADCDSFGADFGFVRLPAVAAVGEVTFARFTSSVTAFVPVGAAVSTSDNSQRFLVTGDLTNPAFGAASNGYSVGANVASLKVPVVAFNTGAASNVQAGAVATLSSALPGIDTVTNAEAVTGGLDAGKRQRVSCQVCQLPGELVESDRSRNRSGDRWHPTGAELPDHGERGSVRRDATGSFCRHCG